MSGQSWKLHVETCTPEEYLKFLEDLRNELAEHWTMGPDHGPILALPSNSVEWIHICLETDSNWITLWVSRANLYVKGFETSDGRIFELAKNRAQQVLDGSTRLGFGGSYPQLQRAAGLDHDQLKGLTLGLETLTFAVNCLATTQTKQVTAVSLLAVVWMISEAARFRKVAQAAATRSSDVVVDSTMVDLVRRWGNLSRRVLQAFVHPSLVPSMIRHGAEQDLGINNEADALETMGILLYALPSFMRGHGWPPSGSTPPGEAALFYYTVGATLAEVFYVTIDNIDGESPGDLYGTIAVTDGYSSQYLFNRGRDESQSIYPGDNALLTGLAKPISANDYFTIDLNLKDKDVISADDEVAKDRICWNPYEGGNVWNQSIKKVVRGRYGQATVCYGVFENAVVARVEVTVVKADNEDPAAVYGTVQAANNLEVMELFSKGKTERVKVGQGKLIPLSRSALVVPLNDALKISAVLYDYDYLSRDDNFADGSATFTPKTHGTEKHNIAGPYGQVEVQVTWSLF